MGSFAVELSRVLGPIAAATARDLDAAVADARVEYAGLAVSDATLAAFAARRVQNVDSLLALRISELLFACACASGQPAAMELLERRCQGAFAKTATRYLGGDVDELWQRVRELVFVGRGGRAPKIESYTGRGELAAWVSVIAVRLALREQRRARVGSDSGLARALAGSRADPELDYLKNAYRRAFRRAFRAAIEGLPAAERKLLHHRFVDGLSGREIAQALAVHPATVSRRLDAALERLRAATLQQLGQQMQIAEPEVESVMRLVQSHLEASVARYLRELSG